MSSSARSEAAKASKQNPSSPLRVISLFTGAGGLDLGFEAAGFETRVAVEMNAVAVATLRKNRQAWRVIDQSIHSEEASTRHILRGARLKEGEADVLIGGPPCQPFSKSGYWASGDAKRLEDPRADTLAAYLRVLRDTQPKTFLLENVPGIAFDQKDEGLTLLRRSIERINREVGSNYSFQVAMLRAVGFGIPQDRQRVFVIGARDGTQFEFPSPTHRIPRSLRTQRGDPISAALGLEDGLEEPLSAWDAIGDLEDDPDPSLRVTGKWADLLPSIPEGKNYLYHTDRGGGIPLFGWRRRYWNFLLKLAKTLPSWTIAAQPGPAIGPFHWNNRRLSAQELMRLQTFPADYQLVGNLREAQRQVGNAVPSALAEKLALEIRRQLLGHRGASSSRLSLLPQRRGDCPPARPPEAVAEKYLTLVDTHEPHPGTGLGYGAQRRLANA